MQFLNKEKWDQLAGDLQALWMKHIDFGDRIWLAEMERNELINQIHEKKCERYRLRNKDGDLMYYNMLFLGRSCHRHLDPFPCHFQGVLDTIICMSTPQSDEPMNATSVYYNVNNRMQGTVKRYTPYDLSDSPTLTPDDKWIIIRVIERLVGLMEECIEFAQANIEPKDIRFISYNILRRKKDIQMLQKEMKRVKKLLIFRNQTELLRDLFWEWRRVAAEEAYHPDRKRTRGDFELDLN